MCVDYAATVNRFTQIDAFPMPDIQEHLSEIRGNCVFSKIDIKDAYHSVPILEEERKFTAFEADGKLYESTRLPFGVTNGTAGFGRAMRGFTEGLNGVKNFLNDVFIVGRNQEEHDSNLRLFLQRAREYKLSLNSQKCTFNQPSPTFLGHKFEDRNVKPDPDRLDPVMIFPVPTNKKELERFLGLLVNYSKWIKDFPKITYPLFEAKRLCSFPLSAECVETIRIIKKDFANATLAVPINNVPLDLETDASTNAIGAVLSQNGQPIAFFSHKLIAVEERWPVVELEAFAIVKSVEKFKPNGAPIQLDNRPARRFIFTTWETRVSH